MAYSLVPLMGGAYFLQFLDKFIFGQAALFNLRQDLVLRFLRDRVLG